LKAKCPRLEKYKSWCHKVLSWPLPCINDTSQIPGVYLVILSMIHTHTHTHKTARSERYVIRKLQRGLSLLESRCKRWSTKINEDKTQTIYFSHRRRPVEAHLTLKGRNIPFVNSVKYLGVISDRKFTWVIHI